MSRSRKNRETVGIGANTGNMVNVFLNEDGEERDVTESLKAFTHSNVEQILDETNRCERRHPCSCAFFQPLRRATEPLQVALVCTARRASKCRGPAEEVEPGAQGNRVDPVFVDDQAEILRDIRSYQHSRANAHKTGKGAKQK